MIRRTALLVPIAILMSAGAPAAVGGDNPEAAALTTVIKRALAEVSTDFSAIRGKRIDSDRYFTTVELAPQYLDCIVWDRSDSPDMAEINLMSHKQSETRWELRCRSTTHSVSVQTLAAWLQQAVAPHAPPTLSHVSGLNWGDEKSAIRVRANVAKDNVAAGIHGSYYELNVDHVVKTWHLPLPPALGTTDLRPLNARTKKEASAIVDFVRRGLTEAQTKFVRIRGKDLTPRDVEQGDFEERAAAVPFASAFRSCIVWMHNDRWEFYCASAPLTDASFEATVAFLKHAVASNLPAGFTFRPSPTAGILSWDGPYGFSVVAKISAEESRPYRPYYQVSVLETTEAKYFY